jgi:xanthine/uracil/vitamin C permease (AzgA family)
VNEAPYGSWKLRGLRRLQVLAVILAVTGIAVIILLGSGTVRGAWAWAIFLGWTAGFLVAVALADRLQRSLSAPGEKAD